MTAKWPHNPGALHSCSQEIPAARVRERTVPEAYIYDHLRTPRGKGRPDGGLHTVSPVEMLAQVLIRLRERNDLDTSLVEDIIAGCGSPIGEQGSAIGRSASLAADYALAVPGQQIHRYCSSGL